MTPETPTSTTNPIAPAAGTMVEKLKGKAKEAVGTVIGDEQLVTEGHLHEAKAEATEKAADLSQAAAVKQAEAELVAREKQAAAEQQRIAAETTAAAEQAAVEQETERKEAQVERDAAAARESAAAVKRQRLAAGDREEFDAARTYSAEIAEADEIAAKARRVKLSARLPKVSQPVDGLTGQLRSVPGRALSAYLTALRLPLTTYEKRTGSDGSAASVAFERLDASLRQLVGSVVKDPALLAEARRENVEVGRLGEAAELSAAAEEKRARADARLAEAKQAADKQKTSAESAAQQQAAKVKADEAAAKQTARKQAADAKSAAAAKAADRKAAVESSERVGTAAALRKEQEALAAERAALTRETDVIRLDDAVDASKAARSKR